MLNFRLQQEFFNTKSDFLLNGIPAKEQFMFHGTNVANIDSILNFNLRPDFQPIDRPKGAAYGEGIYFSEFPCVGVSYGTLIVCRVLAGRVQVQLLFIYVLSNVLGDISLGIGI